MDKLKVIVVDEKVVLRKTISDAVENTGMASVAHTASNISIAEEWLEQSDIDVILLSAEILNYSKTDLVSHIRERFPALDIILTVENGLENVPLLREALKRGVSDYIVKTGEPDPEKMQETMKTYLKTSFANIGIKKCMPPAGSVPRTTERKAVVQSSSPPDNPDLIVIASSTGGPAALETILTMMPARFPAPILVIQHMPPGFTGIFAGSMAKKCSIEVAEAGEGDRVNPGRVLIAPGGMHMALERQNCDRVAVRLLDLPFVNGVKPSADILFQSVAQVYEGRKILAVILTGMGNDGVNGVLEMKKRCNCWCITQDEGSCIVYGMPKCVSEAGLSDEEADLKDIASRICRIAYSGGK